MPKLIFNFFSLVHQNVFLLPPDPFPVTLWVVTTIGVVFSHCWSAHPYVILGFQITVCSSVEALCSSYWTKVSLTLGFGWTGRACQPPALNAGDAASSGLIPWSAWHFSYHKITIMATFRNFLQALGQTSSNCWSSIWQFDYRSVFPKLKFCSFLCFKLKFRELFTFSCLHYICTFQHLLIWAISLLFNSTFTCLFLIISQAMRYETFVSNLHI